MKALIVLALLSAGSTAAEVDPKMKAYLDYMSLSFACSGAESRQFSVAKDAALRAVARYQPATTFTPNDVNGLARGLRDGEVQPPKIDRGDCDKLLLDAREALP